MCQVAFILRVNGLAQGHFVTLPMPGTEPETAGLWFPPGELSSYSAMATQILHIHKAEECSIVQISYYV